MYLKYIPLRVSKPYHFRHTIIPNLIQFRVLVHKRFNALLSGRVLLCGIVLFADQHYSCKFLRPRRNE